MSNRIHLEDVSAVNAAVLLDLPIDQLDLLLNEAQSNVTAAEAVLEILKTVLSVRFEKPAAEMRRSAGKDTGTVRVVQGDYEVMAELAKKVLWDQEKLPDLLDKLIAPVETLSKLVKVEIKINERVFEALAPEHKALLMPARVVKTGKPTYSLKPLAEG